jgi:phosphoglycolate phosphatase
MLERRDMPGITVEQYYEYIDTPIIKFYEHLFPVEPETFDETAKEFQNGYALHCNPPVLHDGAMDLLKALADKGVRQYIVSSAQEKQIAGMLDYFGIAHYFDAVLAAGDRLAESKVERTKRYFLERGIKHERTLMVGDTLHDLYTARALGADCLLLTKGHQSKEILERGGGKTISSLYEI